MFMFGWGASVFYHLRRPPAEALHLYAVGKQWMWKFQHLEGQREINELHVPTGRPIKVTVTSAHLTVRSAGLSLRRQRALFGALAVREAVGCVATIKTSSPYLRMRSTPLGSNLDFTWRLIGTR